MAAGSRAVERGLRDDRRRPGDAALQRHRRPRSRARRPTSSRTSRGRSARSTSTSASARDGPATSRPTSPTTTSASTRTTGHELPRGQGRRSRVAAQSAAGGARAARRATTCSSSTARGRRSRAEMERAGVPVEFVDGLRVTPPEGIAIVRASLHGGQRGALRRASASGPCRLAGDEIGLVATPRAGARTRRRGPADRALRRCGRRSRRARSPSSPRSPR